MTMSTRADSVDDAGDRDLQHGRILSHAGAAGCGAGDLDNPALQSRTASSAAAERDTRAGGAEPTLAPAIDEVAAVLPASLFPEVGRGWIRRIADLLPASAVEFFGFETYLGGRARPPDCAFNLSRAGAEYLAGTHPLPGADRDSVAAWDKLRRFYREWGDTRQGDRFCDATATWLEFDSSSREPLPNLLFGYWPDHPETRRPLPWLVGEILPMLLGGPLSTRFADSVRRCFAVHPAAGDFQVGVMLARSIPAVRICVFDLTPDQVAPYLRDVGWPGPPAQIEGIRDHVDALAPHADFVALHLDVGEQVYPRMGIEPGFKAGPWARQPHLEPRWHGQFDALVRRGLCTPRERDELLAWVGYQAGAADPRGQVVLRGLSHLKIAAHSGGDPQAKAYIGLALRPSPAAPRGAP